MGGSDELVGRRLPQKKLPEKPLTQAFAAISASATRINNSNSFHHGLDVEYRLQGSERQETVPVRSASPSETASFTFGDAFFERGGNLLSSLFCRRPRPRRQSASWSRGISAAILVFQLAAGR